VLKLRLRRMGAKRQPSYRIVVAESSSPRDGRFVETIGIYNPKTQPMTLRVDNERAKYWLEHGAQPTDTVRSLLVRVGVVEGRVSQKGIAEGYVTEPPRRGVAPQVMPVYGGGAGPAAIPDEAVEAAPAG
jgi:small subunit ribosomal protein S16